MIKKKRNIIVIIACVLIVALVLSLSLGLTLGRKPKSIFTVGDEVHIDVAAKSGEIVSSSVTVDDLNEEYRSKLAAFTQTDLTKWQSDNIFRNYIYNPYSNKSKKEAENILEHWE